MLIVPKLLLFILFMIVLKLLLLAIKENSGEPETWLNIIELELILLFCLYNDFLSDNNKLFIYFFFFIS